MMVPLVSRPSVGRKPVGQQLPQQQAPQHMNQASLGSQSVQQLPVFQQHGQQGQQGQQGQVYQQLPQQAMQPTVYQQQPTQRPSFQQGQPQQPTYQQAIQQQQVYQQQGIQQLTQPQPMVQHTMQQQPVYQQQAPQQPIYQQQNIPQTIQQYQQTTQQQPVQQKYVQQVQQQVQQRPAQIQQPQQQTMQLQSVPQLQQQLSQWPSQQQSPQELQQTGQQLPIQQQPVQQQIVQQRPTQQHPVQQPTLQQQIQQHPQGQRLPTPSNVTPYVGNRQSISSAASVRSVSSATSSHTNPPQTFGSPTGFPTSASQHTVPNFLACSLCSTDLSNDSTHLECLACTAAQIPTLFCTQCCVSKRAVTNHHHHMSNFVSVSDAIIFDPEVSAHGWELRKSAIGISWYHHKGSKLKTFEKPKSPIPVTQPQIFRTDSNPLDGWEEIKDPDGRLFYYHRATKVSRWTQPQGSQLPAGWKECTNPDGRTYYLNTISQATTWDRPSGPPMSSGDDRRPISSANSTLDKSEWSSSYPQQSISPQAQSMATPQSPNSVRSSTILETTEWSSTEIERSTVPAHRAASVPNSVLQTTNWSSPDPQHRPVPTRADTQPVSIEWEHGRRRPSRTFSKDSIASGSVAATKAVVNSTKSAASATAKGVKVVGKKLQNSKNAQRIVAGVGMAAVNAVLIDQLGVSIPTSLGTAAVGLVNVVDFNGTTTAVDVTDTSTTGGDDAVDSADVSAQENQAGMPDVIGSTSDVNQGNTIACDDYVVGGSTDIVETTVVQENLLVIPSPTTTYQQQPRQTGASGTNSIHHTNPSASRDIGPGPVPGSTEWEFSSMQRPAAMFGSHIPIHVPSRASVPVARAGVQNQSSAPHLGNTPHTHSPRPGNFQNVAQSHIPIQTTPHATLNQSQLQNYGVNPPNNLGQSQTSHPPQGLNQFQTNLQQQGQVHQQSSQLQPVNQPQSHQIPQAQQAYGQNQHQSLQSQLAHMSNQQHGSQPQGSYHQQVLQPQQPNQPPFNQQQSPSHSQRPQFQNTAPHPGMQNNNTIQQSGQSGSSNPSKPMLKPQQKAALMKAGMKIGTSLLKSALRSSMSGNSGGNDDNFDVNDNSFDFGDSSNFNMGDSDSFNDGDNTFDSYDNLDDVTASYDQPDQEQDQDQFVDASQQLDDGLNGDSCNAGLANDTNDYGDNDQSANYDGPQDNMNDGASCNDMVDQQGTDTTNYDPTLSAQAGFDVAQDITYNQQSDINQQAQGILQASMADDNAAMIGVFPTPDASYNDQADINQLGQGVLQTSTDNDNAAMNGFFTTPDVNYNDQPDINESGQGVLQTSLDDDNVAMNGYIPSQDTAFPQDFASNSIPGTDGNTGVGDNLWTINLPDTSSLSTAASQTYAGLTSASVSGPMTDYYDGLDNFGGEFPIDQDSNQSEDQDFTTPNDNTGFFEDQTLTSAEQALSVSQDIDTDAFTSPDQIANQDSQTTDQLLCQSQDAAQETTSQPDNFASQTPTNDSDLAGGGGIAQPPASISQLYDGSAYDDPDSAGSSPVNTQSTGLTGSGMEPPPTVITQSPSASPSIPALAMPIPMPMPTPDPMPDPTSLMIGQ